VSFLGLSFDIVIKCSKRHQFLAEITWERVSGLDKGPRLRVRA